MNDTPQVKLQVKKRRTRGKGKTISMPLDKVPIGVHLKMKQYQIGLIGRYHRTFSIKEAYVELLKEATKTIDENGRTNIQTGEQPQASA